MIVARIYVVDLNIGVKVYWKTMIEEKNDINYSVFLRSGG